MSDQRICTRCYMVVPLERETAGCFGERLPHLWVDAVWEPCPYLQLTPTGRVTAKRARDADALCLAADDDAHGPHHYGDRFRRHFVPGSTA